MPSTFLFLLRLAILAGVTYGAMYALATFVKPTPETVSIRIDQQRLSP